MAARSDATIAITSRKPRFRHRLSVGNAIMPKGAIVPAKRCKENANGKANPKSQIQNEIQKNRGWEQGCAGEKHERIGARNAAYLACQTPPRLQFGVRDVSCDWSLGFPCAGRGKINVV